MDTSHFTGLHWFVCESIAYHALRYPNDPCSLETLLGVVSGKSATKYHESQVINIYHELERMGAFGQSEPTTWGKPARTRRWQTIWNNLMLQRSSAQQIYAIADYQARTGDYECQSLNFVYFVGNEDWYKIGFTGRKNVLARVRELEGRQYDKGRYDGSHLEIHHVIWCMGDGFKLEQSLHNKFQHKVWLHREYYKGFTTDDIRFIKSIYRYDGELF